MQMAKKLSVTCEGIRGSTIVIDSRMVLAYQCTAFL